MALRTPLLWFFEDGTKTTVHSAAVFSPSLSCMFSTFFVKVLILGHARSGHQVRSNNTTMQKKLYNRATTTIIEGKLLNFRNMIGRQYLPKRMYQIYYICDLRSGHFRDIARAAFGGKYCPPPPLLDIGYNLKTAQDNGTKLSVPYPTSIWHVLRKVCEISSEFFEKMTF